MSRLGRYYKTMTEKKRYTIDYTDWLDVGEAVTSVDFVVLGAPTTPPLVVDLVQVLPTGLGVQYYVSGGLDGVAYEITATLTTNQGPQIREDAVFFQIKEP